MGNLALLTRFLFVERGYGDGNDCNWMIVSDLKVLINLVDLTSLLVIQILSLGVPKTRTDYTVA